MPASIAANPLHVARMERDVLPPDLVVRDGLRSIGEGALMNRSLSWRLRLLGGEVSAVGAEVCLLGDFDSAVRAALAHIPPYLR